MRGVVKQTIRANEVQLSDTKFSVLDILRDQVTEVELIQRHIYHIKEQIHAYNRGELRDLWGIDVLMRKKALLNTLEDRNNREFKYLQTLLDEVDLIQGGDHEVVVYYLMNPDLSVKEVGDELGYTLSATIKTLSRYNNRLSGSDCGRKIRGSKLDELRIALADAQIPLK